MKVAPFVKQLFVASSPLLASLAMGGALSYPTVLLHQLKRNDTEIVLDFDTASWIGSIQGLAGLPSILMPLIMQRKGRKFAFIVACLIAILGWTLTYSANTAAVLLASESFLGFGSNSIYAVTCLSITELMAPQYRDSFIQVYYILEAVTMALNGLLTQFVHWKTISLIMCVPMIPALIIACMWPESPYWLAYKGEFSKCEEAFTWLRGTDDLSNKELVDLIAAQKLNMINDKLNRRNTSFKYLWNKITRKDFYVPLAHICILQFSVHGIGCLALLIYSIELFQKSSSNEDLLFYGGFILNAIQVVGLSASVVLDRFFKKKTRLLYSIFGAALALIGASVASSLQTYRYLPKDTLLSFYCLIAYNVTNSLGVMPLAHPVASALMPVKHRGIGGVIYVINNCFLFTMTLKLTPYLFKYFNIWGTFLVFAMNASICGILLWKLVPETKGRTLQEIENFYTFGRFVVDDQSNGSMLNELEVMKSNDDAHFYGADE